MRLILIILLVVLTAALFYSKGYSEGKEDTLDLEWHLPVDNYMIHIKHITGHWVVTIERKNDERTD